MEPYLCATLSKTTALPITSGQTGTTLPDDAHLASAGIELRLFTIALQDPTVGKFELTPVPDQVADDL